MTYSSVNHGYRVYNGIHTRDMTVSYAEPPTVATIDGASVSAGCSAGLPAGCASDQMYSTWMTWRLLAFELWSDTCYICINK